MTTVQAAGLDDDLARSGVVIGWYLLPDDPTAQEGLAWIFVSMVGLVVLVAAWGLLGGLAQTACALATPTLERCLPRDERSYGLPLSWVLPGAVVGTQLAVPSDGTELATPVTSRTQARLLAEFCSERLRPGPPAPAHQWFSTNT